MSRMAAAKSWYKMFYRHLRALSRNPKRDMASYVICYINGPCDIMRNAAIAFANRSR